MTADLLRALAERTAHAPEPQGTGRYHYVHTKGVHLVVSHYLKRSGERTVTTRSVEPYERRDWMAADGSGRIEVTKDSEFVQPTGDYGPGQLPGQLLITAADEATVEAGLNRLMRETTTSGVVKAVHQVWNLQVVTPALQRLLLLRLAKCADLAVDEPCAVTHVDDARHRRKQLAFCPETGMLLTAEELALEGSRIQGVVSRTEWLYSGYCPATTPPSGH
ncbi:hypothetical protein ABZX92_23825 [Lentzea sp. NPDC006480]|uniref:hypothetical protein n=1 Tax=Lentzea sp. NPDC006480 TaxID=3157176 RepID=UPI0033B44279